MCDRPPKGVTDIREPLKEYRETRGDCNHPSGKVTLTLWPLVQHSLSFTFFLVFTPSATVAGSSVPLSSFFFYFTSSIFPFSPSVGYPKERRLTCFAGLCGSASQDLGLCLIACLYLFLFTLSSAKTTLPLPHTCCFPLIYFSFLCFTLSAPNQPPFSSSFFFSCHSYPD